MKRDRVWTGQSVKNIDLAVESVMPRGLFLFAYTNISDVFTSEIFEA